MLVINDNLIMKGINVRTNKKPIMAEAKAIAEIDAPAVLDTLRELMQGRTHGASGLQFGGALLAPHISSNVMSNLVKPAFEKLKDLGKAAKDHPLTEDLLAMQDKILQSKPSLKSQIANLNVNKNIEKLPTNPFEHMNEQQLYHHVMNIPHREWTKIQETAGVLAGKARTRLGGSLARGHLHDIVKEHVPPLHDIVRPMSTAENEGEPFNKISHLMDISMSSVPKHAAERLEREIEGGSFADVLKGALWTSALAELKKNKSKG